MMRAWKRFAYSKLTATAGTAITCLIPPMPFLFTCLTKIAYRALATAHTITVMKVLGVARLVGDHAASATVLTLTADPGVGTVAGAIAASDWVCVELDNGSYFAVVVSSVSGLRVTIGTGLPSAATGKRVWFFGAPADHVSSQTSGGQVVGSQFTGTASVLEKWEDPAGGVGQSQKTDEPLLVHSDNATNAGTFEQITGCWDKDC